MNRASKSLTDQELLNLVKIGNIFAYREIYDRYAVLLYKHAFKRLQSKEDCSDIIQTIFITLWEKRDSLNITENLSNYLYTSVRNAIFNLIGKRKTNGEYLVSIAHFSIGYYAATDHLAREKQLQNIINDEIERLPTRTKEIFKLSRQEHLTHKQIAEKLSLSEQTVKTTVNNALKVLRLKLGSFMLYLF